MKKRYNDTEEILCAGFGGQAAELRGEPNAVGIITKRAPRNGLGAFLTDDDLELIVPLIDAAFARLRTHLLTGGTVVWPSNDVGTGRAALSSHAPSIAAYIDESRVNLERRAHRVIGQIYRPGQ